MSARPSSAAPTPAAVPLPAERVLQTLGGGAPLAEDLIGDLVEEHAERAARDGVAAARRWYAVEALRAVPHLLRGAVRHGTPQGRARLATWLAWQVLAPLGGLVALLLRDGPPARIVAGGGATANRVVVSTTAPVTIPVRVLDRRGHVLDPAQRVRFARESGAARVTPDGVVACTERGETVLRATLGAVTERVRVSCQPVWYVSMRPWYNFVLGDAPQELRVGAVGLDGRPVTRLSADVRVADPRIASLDGTRVRARAAGRTWISVRAAGSEARGAVTVFEPVRTLVGLRDDQRYVLATVRLRPGEQVRWPLPVGEFSLVNHVGDLGDAPELAVDGPVRCMPEPGPGVHRTFCLASRRGATVTLARPGAAPSAIVGALALER